MMVDVLRSCKDVVASDAASDVQCRLQFRCVLYQPRRSDAASVCACDISRFRSHSTHPANILPGDCRRSQRGTSTESAHDRLVKSVSTCILLSCFLPERDYITFRSLPSQIHLSSLVCLSCVMFVCFTQGVETFCNIFLWHFVL